MREKRDNRRMKDLNAPLEQITQLEKLNDRALGVEIYFIDFDLKEF